MDTPPVRADALLVVDLQVDYFRDPSLAALRADLARRCSDLARRAARAGCPVIEIRTVHAKDRSTWTLDMLDDDCGVVIEGTRGADPVEGVDLGDAELVLKTRDSAFHATGLSQLLERPALGASSRRPALTGVSTESCVLATAIDAYAHDLRVVLVTDAIASADDELHHHTLERLRRQYRQTMATAEQVVFERSA